MAAVKDRLVCRLRSVRKARGLSQSELAERVGVKRQAIYDMESGRYMPNTALAIRLAREFGCRVEDLFSLDESGDEWPVTLVEPGSAADHRVSVARVRDRYIAYPLDGRRMLIDGFQAADGLLDPGSGGVRLLSKADHVEKKVLLLGCDPAFSILSAHVSRCTDGPKVHCRFASSRLALERLAGGYAHIAGTHLHNPEAADSNLALARRCLAGSSALVTAFSTFEEGLMVARGNPLGIRSVADLAGGKARFVNREPGAALRVLLDERLAQAGVSGEEVSGYDRLLSNHSECAQMVAMGLADAALGLRAVAAAYGLGFVPVETVRCDLVIPADLLQLEWIRQVLDVLQSRALRDELASLPGYESACTGTVVGEV